MADGSRPQPEQQPEPQGFPVATALASLVGLFLFLGLVLVAYYSPNYLTGPAAEPKADPAVKLADVRAKNQAVLDGADPGVKLSADRATTELLAGIDKTKTEKSKLGRLPFPVEPPKAAPADTKEKDKK